MKHECSEWAYVALWVLVWFVCVTFNTCKGDITAPKHCNAGELVVVTSTETATWTVYPQEYRTSYYTAGDGSTVCFASPKAGQVVFIAATIVDGKPVISTHTLYNGVEAPENSENGEGGTITPPEPVDTLEGVIKAEIKKVTSEKKTQELTALADSFASVTDGIDRGTIQTPEGARATFRALWIENSVKIDAGTAKTYEPLITAISEKVDNTSIQTIKADYTTAVTTIRATYTPATAAQGAVKNDDSKTTPPSSKQPQSTCPNGNCPTGNCPNGNCNKNGYNWGWYR